MSSTTVHAKHCTDYAFVEFPNPGVVIAVLCMGVLNFHSLWPLRLDDGHGPPGSEWLRNSSPIDLYFCRCAASGSVSSLYLRRLHVVFVEGHLCEQERENQFALKWWQAETTKTQRRKQDVTLLLPVSGRGQTTERSRWSQNGGDNSRKQHVGGDEPVEYGVLSLRTPRQKKKKNQYRPANDVLRMIICDCTTTPCYIFSRLPALLLCGLTDALVLSGICLQTISLHLSKYVIRLDTKG